MNNFTVVWSPTAEATLAKLWLSAAEPRTIQEASDFLEAEMAHSPNAMGLEISAGLRVAGAGPLLILFRVSNPDRRVTVHAVKLL